MLQSHRRRGGGGGQCAIAATIVGGGYVAVAEREAAGGVERGRVVMVTVVSGALLGRGQRRSRRVVQLRLEGRDGPRRVGLAEAAAAVLPRLLLVIVVVALVPLVGVGLVPVHRLHVLPERGGVGVALGAAGHFARVRFLRTANKVERVSESGCSFCFARRRGRRT